MRTKLERLQAGLANLPQATAAKDASAAAPPPKPATVPVNLRMPEEMRAWYVQAAARAQAESGRPTTAQQMMLDALGRAMRGAS